MYKIAASAIASILLFFCLRYAVSVVSTDSVATGPVTVDAGIMLGDCPDSPNCVSSNATRKAQYVAPLAHSVAEDQVIQRIAELVAEDSSIDIVAQTNNYIHLTHTTPVMGYIDDQEILVDPSTQTLLVRSASRLGYSDWGTNRGRVEQLRHQAASLLTNDAS